ncbi:glycosyltransferase family 4 protein [Halopseudomonas sp. SMJS2]|uniref:glycosyltransferase family 4 protein n=1 Tax=Halopseudomonas sp. SMJS2 TaxID=3041098 RepID=UPI0024536864|nr:glycosyltransferase family 4 protein [Halopseudomonas sp. SMJS2]WGK60360.1 glycosyltransferase family 4 protein [Halopseudomonas sp. SMJS2]
MRVLLLSFYFAPDLSAGSFRNTAFVESLKRKLPAGSEIDVVTTLPNRYAGYSAEAREYERSEGLSIKRVQLPTHKSGMLDQSKSFFTYVKAVRAHVAGKEYDIVYASSSRLMTAALGAWVSRTKKVPLYLDIRDIFVDTIKDVLPSKLALLMKPIFSVVEKWTITRAARLNVVSEGFIPYFESRYPDVSKVVFTNGIDDQFINLDTTVVNEEGSGKSNNEAIEVVYAGNIGEGQGLHNIVPAVAKKLGGRIRFRIIGAGGRLQQLQGAVDALNLSNVTIEPPVSRAELISAYQKADVLFLHLNDYDAFHKVLPSKLFEYGALGKPIWAGVAGHAATFVRSHLTNATVFAPCDAVAAVHAFDELDIVDAPREEFIAQFKRTAIMDAMAEDLVATASKTS